MNQADQDAHVSLQVSDGVATVELSNPRKRNALTWGMYDSLDQICIAVSEDSRVRAMVIRGAGGEAFAAGTDIAQFSDFRTGKDGVAYEQRVGRILDRLLAVPVPVISVVQGPAVGAGLAVAACSDIVLATPESVFGAPIARTLGNCLPLAVVARLQRRLGAARTMTMLLTSSMLSASAAAESGFVAAVIPAADLDAQVTAITERIKRGAPLTVAALKEIDRRLTDELPDGDDLLERCYGSEDFHEGVTAFLERRPPRWQGR